MKEQKKAIETGERRGEERQTKRGRDTMDEVQDEGCNEEGIVRRPGTEEDIIKNR